MKKFIVHDICINQGKTFEVEVPTDFTEHCVLTAWLRAYLFHHIDVTFNEIELDDSTQLYNTKQPDVLQSISSDLLSVQLPHKTRLRVEPYFKNKMLVEISDEALEVYDGDVTQAIFEQMIMYFEIEYIYCKLPF